MGRSDLPDACPGSRREAVSAGVHLSGPRPAGPALSVIVPTYNEAPNIVELIDRLRAALVGLDSEIIVVDDDSPDRTARVALDHARRDGGDSGPGGDSSVSVVVRRHVRGLHSAVLEGMARARGEALAVIDADLQHDESALPAMARTVLSGQADLCVCSRPALRGMWRLRSAVTSLALVAARVLLPGLRRVGDPLSGFFVVSRAHYLASARSLPSGRGFKVLWLFLCAGPEPRTAEVVRPLHRRRRGRSKLTPVVLGADLLDALALRYRGLQPARSRSGGPKRRSADGAGAASLSAPSPSQPEQVDGAAGERVDPADGESATGR